MNSSNEEIEKVPGPMLDYNSDPASCFRSLRFWVALVLATPGAMCWGTYVLMAMLNHTEVPVLDFMKSALADIFWPLWAMAVVAAIISLLVFIRPRKGAYPWYVVACLWINIPGLLLSLAVVLSAL